MSTSKKQSGVQKDRTVNNRNATIKHWEDTRRWELYANRDQQDGIRDSLKCEQVEEMRALGINVR